MKRTTPCRRIRRIERPKPGDGNPGSLVNYSLYFTTLGLLEASLVRYYSNAEGLVALIATMRTYVLLLH